MHSYLFTLSNRIRWTPYSDKIEALSIKSYSSYNHVLLATVFEPLEQDCWCLAQHVQMWDVSCQRQIDFIGRDSLMHIRAIEISKKIMGVAFLVYLAPRVIDRGKFFLGERVQGLLLRLSGLLRKKQILDLL